MFSKRIKCVCGHEFTHTHHDDGHQIVDFSEMKEAAIDEVNHHRRNVGYGVPVVEIDFYDVEESTHTVVATCPSCFTKLPMEYHFDVASGGEIEISKRLQDRITPLYVPPVPQIRFENQRHPIQPVVKNFVYNAQLSRANGRATLQCTNTKEIKYL